MLNKLLSFELFWAWAIPLVSLLHLVSPVELNSSEVVTWSFLAVLWWAAYPFALIQWISNKSLKEHGEVPIGITFFKIAYFAILGALITNLITNFIYMV